MKKIYVTKSDYKELMELLSEKEFHDEYDEMLFHALQQAELIEPQDTPKTVITMNSHVKFFDTKTQTYFTFTLVFPKDADVGKKKISVFSPIGGALLGRQQHDTISLQTPVGIKEFEIKEILYQPEAAGVFSH